MDRDRFSSGSPFEPVIGFSRAVRMGDLIAVSGTGPIGAHGKTAGIDDPAAQARRCLEIIEQSLKALGAELTDVVRTRTYLTRADDWKTVGTVHGQYFADIRPASTMLVVAALLNPEWLVEIEADAIVARR